MRSRLLHCINCIGVLADGPGPSPGGDEGNETGDVVYFGTGCAATAGKRTVKDIRADVKAAEESRAAEAQVRRDAEGMARIAARDAWIVENVGPDALDNPRKYGYASVVRLCMAALKAIGC